MAHDGYRPVCMFIHNCFFVCGIFQISCCCSHNQTLFPVEVFFFVVFKLFFLGFICVLSTDKSSVYAVSLETVLAGHENWVYGVHWQPPLYQGTLIKTWEEMPAMMPIFGHALA